MYALLDNLAGSPQVQNIGLVADATPRLPQGTFVTASDPWWGTGEFMYARASAGIRAFGVCVLTPVFDSTLNTWRYDAVEAPNTANLGRMVMVSMNVLTTGQYGFFCIAGLTPVNCQASVAADTTFGIAAAGQGGANSAGKQILNARVIAAGATTVAKANCTTQGLSTLLQVPNSDGWFVGAYLSGTGIAATTTVVSVDPSGRFVTMSLASTAAVAGTVTATYNNATIFYNVAHLNRPFAQGAIT
jgi:hypothetical protein